MMQRSSHVLQASPELSLWTNHMVCLLSFPFILALESTVLLSVNCTLCCYAGISPAPALTRLSSFWLCFAGDSAGGLVGGVRCCLVSGITGPRCKAMGVTSPVLERQTPALQQPVANYHITNSALRRGMNSSGAQRDSWSSASSSL